MTFFPRFRPQILGGMFAGLLLLGAAPAWALLVQPVLIKMTSSGQSVTSIIEVVNDRNRPITVEIGVNRLTIPERGDVVREPDAGDEFQIFPLQAIIPPGARQTFRVRWVGDQALPQGKLYMFSTAELPVQMEPGQTGVSLFYAVESVVAVSPLGASPDLSIVGVTRKTNTQGVAGLEVLFANDGPAIGFVADAELTLAVEGSPWSLTLQPSDLSNAFGLGVVPANGRRAMFLANADVPPQGDVTARYKPRSAS